MKEVHIYNDIWFHSHCSQSFGILRSEEASFHLGVSDTAVSGRNGMAGHCSMAWESDRPRVSKNHRLEYSIGWALNKDHLAQLSVQ